MSSSAYRRRGPWTCKPLSLVLEEHRREQEMPIPTTGDPGSLSHDHGSSVNLRHLGFWDLVSIGVGGTIGSGIFVLAGAIAHVHAGPATFLSFAISGLAASCSGLCYAEWAGRLPAAGSTYIYALVSLGEVAAVLAGACLTLEYGVSGAAVARSWADKVLEYLEVQLEWDLAESFATSWMARAEDSNYNPLAGLISLAAVALLACGVQESKTVTNIFTVLKVVLVAFMIIGGFLLFDITNLQPTMPHGMGGVLRGATSSFFAFLGYDEVCCLASEAKRPSDMPKAVLATLGIVTSLYILAAIALVGMVPSADISETSGFPSAFATRNWELAARLTAAGEVITLPVVVLISLLAQPRLFAAMAQDGLLPRIFTQRNSSGNLFWSNIWCGIPMAILATFVPFAYLDDGISVGILVAFNMTNTSLILMKCAGPTISTSRAANTASISWLSRRMTLFHILAFVSGLVSRFDLPNSLPFLMLLLTSTFAIFLHQTVTKQPSFGALWLQHEKDDQMEDMDSMPQPSWEARPSDTASFETPLVPLLPLIGICMNWYLIAQLEWFGLGMLALYLALVSVLYYGCARRLGHYLPWGSSVVTSGINSDSHAFREEEGQPMLLRELSLPKR